MKRDVDGMRWTVLVVAALLQVGVASAAGPYDGTWRGGATDRNGAGCSTKTTAALVVDGDRIAGDDTVPPASFLPTGKFAIAGTIAGDGTVKASVGDWPLSGKFAGDSFEGYYVFGPCTMIMRLTRAK
jgi:hypothetical protein